MTSTSIVAAVASVEWHRRRQAAQPLAHQLPRVVLLPKAMRELGALEPPRSGAGGVLTPAAHARRLSLAQRELALSLAQREICAATRPGNLKKLILLPWQKGLTPSR